MLSINDVTLSFVCLFRFFHIQADKFESQMITYRQQIEEMESHLTSVQHSDALSPQGILHVQMCVMYNL